MKIFLLTLFLSFSSLHCGKSQEPYSIYNEGDESQEEAITYSPEPLSVYTEEDEQQTNKTFLKDKADSDDSSKNTEDNPQTNNPLLQDETDSDNSPKDIKSKIRKGGKTLLQDEANNRNTQCLNQDCGAKDYNYTLDSSKNKELLVAISNSNFVKAKTLLLEARANPNYRLDGDVTAIHILSYSSDEQGSANFLPTLIEYGADINAQSNNGYTGLAFAIAQKRYHLAQAFLQNEHIDVLITDESGLNILHLFSQANLDNPLALQTLNTILSKGGSHLINAQNKNGRSSIHYAVTIYNIEFLTALVSQPGIDLNLADSEGFVPIFTPISHLSIALKSALHPEEGEELDFDQIHKASQAAQIILNSSHDVDLTIKPNQSLAPAGLLIYIEDNLQKLPEDSPVRLAIEPILTILNL